MPRHPVQCSNSSAGAVAVTAPSAPSMTMQPLANATRSFGNHRTMAFSPAIKAAGTPETDQKPREDERPKAVCRAEQRRPGRRDEHQHALDSTRTIAIQPHADRHLKSRQG